MKKLTYYYGVMGSGKSAQILELKENYELDGKSVLLIKPKIDTRDIGVIRSRNKKEAKCLLFSKTTNLLNLFNKNKCDILIVDEANFCTSKQVEQLWQISQNNTVLAYGVMINYVGKIFTASKRFVELADHLQEIKFKCDCGKDAKINALIIDGKIQYTGSGTSIGDLGKYKPMCLFCWKKQS